MDTKQAIRYRRSNYDLTKQSTLDDQQLYDLLAEALNRAPSSFNSQTSRIVIALGTFHIELWDMVLEKIKKIITEEEAFQKSANKISKLKDSAGTILFYEDGKSLNRLHDDFPLYKKNIIPWSHQGQGILQYMVWLLLADAGMGASLQHYSELIAKPLSQRFNIDPSWILIAQMPFGVIKSLPNEKSKIPVSSRLMILK